MNRLCICSSIVVKSDSKPTEIELPKSWPLPKDKQQQEKPPSTLPEKKGPKKKLIVEFLQPAYAKQIIRYNTITIHQQLRYRTKNHIIELNPRIRSEPAEILFTGDEEGHSLVSAILECLYNVTMCTLH